MRSLEKKTTRTQVILTSGRCQQSFVQERDFRHGTFKFSGVEFQIKERLIVFLCGGIGRLRQAKRLFRLGK